MAQQPEAGDIGQGVDAAHTAEGDARCIELCRAGEHRGVMGVIEAALLQRGAVNANAKRLAEDEGVARPRADVALQMVRIDGPDRHQAVDRLERIDRVPARNWNAGLGADRLAPLEYPADSLHWQPVDRHADQRQREQRRGAHRIDVADRVRRRDAAEVERIVDDRHEEVGRRDQRLLVVELVDRGVVRGLDADEKLFRHDPRHRLGNDLLQYRGRDLAAAAAAVAELGKA